MNPNLDIEILEIMEKHDISYDEALERYERMQKQLELAGDRHKAQSIKKQMTKQKQKGFHEAYTDLYNNDY